MSGIVNISKDARNDAHYRYKMPQLTIKGEGKGNGVKTVLPNISDIAKSLSRPASYPTKFFGCELGAQTMWDEKADRYIVNGTHSADRLRELLDGFIAKFVLCASCKNPETDLIITKDETVLRDCKACGVRKPVDMGHKLVAFILKNPPKKPSKKSKKEGNGDEAPAGEDDGDDEMTRKIKAGAADMSKVKTVDADEVDWSADTSKEAQAARMEKLNSGLQATLINGEEGDEEDAGPYGDLKKWLIDNRASATDAEIYKKAADLGIEKKHRTVQMVVEGLFTEDVLKEIESHTPLLLKLTQAGDKEEKVQKSLLGGVERLTGVIYPDLTPQTPKVLMALYQAEVLDEEQAVTWGKHVSKKYVPKEVSKEVRLAAKPFIKWLEEQESEDEAEDE